MARDHSSGVRVAGKSASSQARTRLSWEPVRQLHDEFSDRSAGYTRCMVSKPAAGKRRWQHFDVADEKSRDTSPVPGASREQVPSADPFCVPVENGTHVLFGSQMTVTDR